MAKALGVSMILSSEEIEAEEYRVLTGRFAALYDAVGLDLKIAIGFY
ncbi:hypothetical protein [Yoonia sp. MH D7]